MEHQGARVGETVSTIEPLENVEEPGSEELPRVTAVEIGRWGPIRERVRLELSWPRTVLVGRNGAGKTLLLEGIAHGLSKPVRDMSTQMPSASFPYEFNLELEVPEVGPMLYQYLVGERIATRPWRSNAHLELVWSERCVNRSSGVELWSQQGGKVKVQTSTEVATPSATSFLRIEAMDLPPATDGGQWRKAHSAIVALGFGVKLVTSDLGRIYREPVTLRRDSDRLNGSEGHWWVDYDSASCQVADELASELWELASHAPEVLEELCALGRRVGVFSEIAFPEVHPGDPDHLDVCIDGMNLGLLSDGTLRAMAILVALLSVGPGGLVLIDEVESSFHPTLLTRILEELTSYGQDRQIVLTTQSLRVVDWARSEEIRLVEWRDGGVHIRPIPPDDVRWLHAHLDDEFSLSDYVYGGSLDDP